MKILFIGGTGTISTAISKKLVSEGHELYLVNRGNRKIISGAHYITADVGGNEADLSALINEVAKDGKFDAVADFIIFDKSQAERDYRLFKDITKQYIFISSASVYQKPLNHYVITESTPAYNPYWEYSRKKIECEDFFMQKYREENFPVTIVRPSHTYDERSSPRGVHGDKGSFQVAKRLLDGKPVIIHGDGTSLWVMTHNSDFAKGFVGLLGNIRAVGETLHITTDEVLTWNQIYACLADALGVPLKAVHISSEYLIKNSDYDFLGSLTGDKANSVVFDNSKLKRLVPTFQPTKCFKDGIKETVDYVLAHPELQIEDDEFDKWCDKIILQV
ncbi:MAG: NAD-dependent epimerase/dehydratase family protein [Ruminococcus sp.]|jgi:nucleoside-diphosphate-sugar epimerase|nr:NAD-dependent epimerase/dehydratase family protein [Ruminococcus sp.]